MGVSTTVRTAHSIRARTEPAGGYSVELFTAQHKQAWDSFVREGKNATFLFYRDYMDYHSDRFHDHSLMVFCEGKLVALLPANLRAPDALISHGGLTYGGFILRRSVALEEVLEILYHVLRFLQERGISRLLYKQIPSFYNTLPDDDIAYGFFLLEARLYRRDCALVVNQADRFRFSKCRKRWINRGEKVGVQLTQDNSFVPFWEQVLVPRLAARYHVRPTHSVDEITLLALRFPENIKQFSAYYDGEIVAGATIYETPTVAHAQYIAVSDRGAAAGALDYLFGWLIEERYKDKRYFDFGICNERDSHLLNHGLLRWKQGFSARSSAHDFYEVRTDRCQDLVPVLQGRI
jgi:Acetyltransferase (GNAT) domain